MNTYREIVNNLNKKLKEAKDVIPEGMIILDKEEAFEIDLREIQLNDNNYETDLGALGRGIGLLSSHHHPYSESIPSDHVRPIIISHQSNSFFNRFQGFFDFT